jgi:uncharacterized membrane protein YesL
MYSFFFSSIVGKQISKAVFTSGIVCGILYLMNYFDLVVILITPAALLTYIPLTLVLVALWITWAVYALAYCARFHGGVKDALRGSLLLMVLHPLRALTVFLPAAAGILVVCIAPGLVAIVPAAVTLACSVTLEKIFKLHGSGDSVKQKEEAYD